MRDSISLIAADRRAAFARQVRTSTGFTWRRPGAVVQGPRLAEGGRAPAPVVRRLTDAPAGRQDAGVERMLRLLASWPEDRPLARTAELAEIAGLIGATMAPAAVSARVTTVLAALQRSGRIEVHTQPSSAHRRERAVLVRGPAGEGGGRVLATAGAPAVWVQDLRARAALAAGLVGGQ